MQVVTNSNITFSMLFLCRVYSQASEEENHQLVFVMEARNQNPSLWNKNTHHRDNGALSIGAFFRLLCPLPVTTYMQGDIPMLRSHMSCIILKFPRKMSAIVINQEIEANESRSFVYNGTQVNVYYTAPIKTSCTGKLCDRQRVNDWLSFEGCGCYSMHQTVLVWFLAFNHHPNSCR